MQENIIKKKGFYKGVDIVCKPHYKSTKIRLYVNYQYVIKSIDENEVIINEPVDNKDICISHEILTLSPPVAPYRFYSV